MSEETTEVVTEQPKAKRSDVMTYVRQLDASAVLGERKVVCCSGMVTCREAFRFDDESHARSYFEHSAAEKLAT